MLYEGFSDKTDAGRVLKELLGDILIELERQFIIWKNEKSSKSQNPDVFLDRHFEYLVGDYFRMIREHRDEKNLEPLDEEPLKPVLRDLMVEYMRDRKGDFQNQTPKQKAFLQMCVPESHDTQGWELLRFQLMATLPRAPQAYKDWQFIIQNCSGIIDTAKSDLLENNKSPARILQAEAIVERALLEEMMVARNQSKEGGSSIKPIILKALEESSVFRKGEIAEACATALSIGNVTAMGILQAAANQGRQKYTVAKGFCS